MASAFNIEAASKIANVSLRQIRYWDQTRLVQPSVQPARGRGSRRLYSFEDLLELRVIARLLEAGLSLQKVRKVTAYLRRHHAEVRRPLANKNLVTDGDAVYISTDPGVVEDALRGGQVMLIVPIGTMWDEMQTTVVMLSDKRTADVNVQGQRYAVTLEPDLEDGGWVAECPALRGCISQGDTLGEARKMIREAVTAWLAAERGEGSAAHGVAKRSRR